MRVEASFLHLSLVGEVTFEKIPLGLLPCQENYVRKYDNKIEELRGVLYPK